MKTPNHALDAQCKLNRRGFLWATATGLAGLAGVLALQQPPASAQKRELTMLSFNNFVPQSDEELRQQATLFGQKHRVKATVDTISGLQIPQKLAAEVETRAGHDVVVLPRSSPYLYQHQLPSLDVLAESSGSGTAVGMISAATIAMSMAHGRPSAGCGSASRASTTSASSTTQDCMSQTPGRTC
jgi:hypothetical protein